MPTDRKKLRKLVLQLVPRDGSAIGNGRLRDAIGEELGHEIDEADYAEVRDELVADGELVKGQGRGGSVRRPGDDDEEGEGETAATAALVLESPVAGVPTKKPRPTKKKPGPSKPTTRGGASGGHAEVLSYRHGDRRKNNPEVGMVDPDTDPVQPKTKWAYDPHLDPALQFDVGRAHVEKLIDDALESGDQEVMRRALEQLRRQAEPYLAWAGKAERTSFEVDTVSLHVHERIDPASILHAVRKRLQGEKGNKVAPLDQQIGLFRAPIQNLTASRSGRRETDVA